MELLAWVHQTFITYTFDVQYTAVDILELDQPWIQSSVGVKKQEFEGQHTVTHKQRKQSYKRHRQGPEFWIAILIHVISYRIQLRCLGE